MLTRRNGNDSNQTNGHSTRASNANGQHNTSSTHHSIRVIKLFKAESPFTTLHAQQFQASRVMPASASGMRPNGVWGDGNVKKQLERSRP